VRLRSGYWTDTDRDMLRHLAELTGTTADSARLQWCCGAFNGLARVMLMREFDEESKAQLRLAVLDLEDLASLAYGQNLTAVNDAKLGPLVPGVADGVTVCRLRRDGSGPGAGGV
jgi:hypothetical protein